jgi:hypothetical protein
MPVSSSSCALRIGIRSGSDTSSPLPLGDFFRRSIVQARAIVVTARTAALTSPRKRTSRYKLSRGTTASTVYGRGDRVCSEFGRTSSIETYNRKAERQERSAPPNSDLIHLQSGDSSFGGGFATGGRIVRQVRLVEAPRAFSHEIEPSDEARCDRRRSPDAAT